MATAPDGTIEAHPDQGFFAHETRVLSLWRYTIDGVAPQPNASSCVRQDHWLGYFVIAAPGVPLAEADSGSGQVPAASQNTLELRVTRTIDDALHEEIALTNYTSVETSFVFAIEVEADFADQAETRKRQQFGEIVRRVDEDALTLEYRVECGGNASAFRCAVTIRPAPLRFEITLAPKQTWRMHVSVTPHSVRSKAASSPPHSTKLDTPAFANDVLATLAQARSDLTALHLGALRRCRVTPAHTVCSAIVQEMR